MRARSALLLGLVLLALASGCAAPPAPADPPPADLLPSLPATTFGDSVRFVLQVTNTTEEGIELEFRSAQTFDFVVERAGSEVWRWSSDHMFTQAVQRQLLPAGETLTFDASWTPPAGTEGEFTVRGVLTASGRSVEQEARFRIP